MALTLEQLANELTPQHDLVFASKPDDAQMRESTSVWLSDIKGGLSFPRLGIEAEAWQWDEPLYTANACFPDGRVLCGIGRGAKHSPLGRDGRPTILGAGPLGFQCLEPFRRWRVTYDGMIATGDVSEAIDNRFDLKRLVPFSFEFELEMVTPAWVQNNPPEKLERLSARERSEAENMGVGWRCEHLFRGTGRYQLDGGTHEFEATGLRVKRQSVRPLSGFNGHSWQSALFRDGRAFGFLAYEPRDGAAGHNDGYIYQNGRMYKARVTKVPWFRRFLNEGDDVSFELESDLGTTRIESTTQVCHYHRAHPGVNNLDLQQGSVRLNWDGQISYGMIERSAPSGLVAS
jgi:hypothetical protein